MAVDVYVIWDTHEEKLWRTRNGKAVWAKPGHAKNAWNYPQSYKDPKFSEQDRYECRKVSFDASKGTPA